jgi:hypothetical protein
VRLIKLAWLPVKKSSRAGVAHCPPAVQHGKSRLKADPLRGDQRLREAFSLEMGRLIAFCAGLKGKLRWRGAGPVQLAEILAGAKSRHHTSAIGWFEKLEVFFDREVLRLAPRSRRRRGFTKTKANLVRLTSRKARTLERDRP